MLPGVTSDKISPMANQVAHKDTSFKVGDIVRVHQRIHESEEKSRTQIFEGIVIGIKGVGENKTFTVRKIATGGVGVEKIFPLSAPTVEKVEVKKPGHVRRAKLYYLRQRVGRRATKTKAAKVIGK